MRFSFLDNRLAALARELRPGEGPCPFVVLEPPHFKVRLTHFSAGRDATYVVLDRAPIAARPAAVTIGYAPFVEGTSLIYDLTNETLQGKARPFTCDLTRSEQLVYAVLPVQIETIDIRLRGQQIEVEFHDARDERIEAALPFQLTATGASLERFESYACTDAGGRYSRALPASVGASPWTVTVRSLLTGCDERTTPRS
jgi:hypothetical protein